MAGSCLRLVGYKEDARLPTTNHGKHALRPVIAGTDHEWSQLTCSTQVCGRVPSDVDTPARGRCPLKRQHDLAASGLKAA
jgi:hypothetical protein